MPDDQLTSSSGVYLWYAAFGSNLLRARFEKYLKGGSAELASHSLEPGARDDSDPIAETTMTAHHELYFAWEAQKWDGGGVAFLSPSPSVAATTCRLYKITIEQFEDVHAQETGMSEPAVLDVDELVAKGSLLQYDRLYGLALHLGTHEDGHPIVTLTTERTDLKPNSPSLGYATTIAKGLLECTMLTPSQVVDYVIATRGVDERLDRSELLSAASPTPT